jgi:hypothetical protein
MPDAPKESWIELFRKRPTAWEPDMAAQRPSVFVVASMPDLPAELLFPVAQPCSEQLRVVRIWWRGPKANPFLSVCFPERLKNGLLLA